MEGPARPARLQFLSGTAQQRSNNILPFWRDAAKTSKPCAAQQTQQDRLGVVVGVVCGGDLSRGSLFQESVAQNTGRFLQTFPGLCGQSGSVAPPQGEGNFPPRAELPAELRVPICLLPTNAVVEVSRPQGDPQPGRIAPQQPEQGHRIRPARERGCHIVAGFQKLIFFNIPINFIFHTIVNGPLSIVHSGQWIVSRSENEKNCGCHWTLTVPDSPRRFFATMHSQMFRSAELGL